MQDSSWSLKVALEPVDTFLSDDGLQESDASKVSDSKNNISVTSLDPCDKAGGWGCCCAP